MNLYQLWWEEFVRQSLLSIPYMEQYRPEDWEEIKTLHAVPLYSSSPFTSSRETGSHHLDGTPSE